MVSQNCVLEVMSSNLSPKLGISWISSVSAGGSWTLHWNPSRLSSSKLYSTHNSWSVSHLIKLPTNQPMKQMPPQYKNVLTFHHFIQHVREEKFWYSWMPWVWNYCTYLGKKIKLSLCLTKHHTMKVYWDGGNLHAFFDLGTRCKWVASFTLRPLYPQGKSPWYPLDRRPGGPQSRSGRRGEAPAGNRTL
jgi:hypothetical protein